MDIQRPQHRLVFQYNCYYQKILKQLCTIFKISKMFIDNNIK